MGYVFHETVQGAGAAATQSRVVYGRGEDGVTREERDDEGRERDERREKEGTGGEGKEGAV